MSALHTHQRILVTSRRANWCLGDLLGADKRLDFSRPFLPETFAWTEPLGFLSAAERLRLNHIRARCYLALFELVEAFVVPFIGAAAEDRTVQAPFRAEALHHFVAEEEKHRKLFTSILQEFDASFGTRCALIGPADEVCKAILSHGPLAVTMAILGLEWMSQAHYVDSVRDNDELDPQFKRLLRYHWIEEAQHARLDALLLQELARRRTEREIAAAIEEYLEIGAFLDGGFKQQAALDLDSLERATGRTLSEDERRQFLEVQHGALRWTFLGCALANRNFLGVLGRISEAGVRRIEEAGSAFAKPHSRATSC